MAIKRVIVFSAHSYIGVALCERFVSEGVEVKGILLNPKNLINKKLLDERLMMIGRNALFQPVEAYESSNYDHTVDLIIHCCDDSVESILMEQDRKLMVESVELAKELNIPYIFISTKNHANKGVRKDHIIFCEQYLSKMMEAHTVFQLPVLFGPFQPPTEKIHQYLVKQDHEKEELIIDEPILYINDAVNAAWDLLSKFQQGKSYSIQTDLNHMKEPSFSFEWQLKTEFAEDERSEIYLIKEPTSVEKGLKAQFEFIDQFREILKNA